MCMFTVVLFILLLYAYSIVIMEPLLSPDVQESPIWRSWVLHRKLLVFVTRTTFEIDAVDELRHLVSEYLKAFDEVCVVRCPLHM